MTYWVVLGSLWWCHASWNHWERKEKSTNDDFCFPCLTSVNHPVLKVFSGDADGFLMLGSRIPLALDPKKKNSCDYKLYGYLRTIIFVAIITQCWIVSFFFYHQSRWIHGSSLLIPKIEEVHSYLIYFFCGFFVHPTTHAVRWQRDSKLVLWQCQVIIKSYFVLSWHLSTRI